MGDDPSRQSNEAWSTTSAHADKHRAADQNERYGYNKGLSIKVNLAGLIGKLLKRGKKDGEKPTH